ncbi:F0F1 ATP synthase subunit A [Peloplasma aerotolerans]|uniref:FoF1 ATP synthase subunit a n=1 Tax=Peloplasma aerotolerans TaxID=3044389 RepID=A0AAW6UBL6_9MOLU|nr:FoF1 ATP synthase subunit a [Mariniplasma sp. M4Ah]MDI6453491.1 FoF1 ATP synthase subunit a [Mariniplasma sp. M4Ah]MDR4968220.1 FoF1 ATP synthase subunit a [Acholeplasmataceae bacterium]
MMTMFLDDLLSTLKNPPTYLLVSFGIMIAIAIITTIIGFKVEKMDVKAKPNKGMTAVLEGVGGFNTFVKSYVGKQYGFITPIVLTMSLYVFISNISGIIALDTPTKYATITFSMSITAFLVIQIAGLKSKGLRHFKGIFEPLWPMFPLNLVSEFVPILSMALRLFGNIAGGALILTLIYGITGWASVFITPAFHLIFDIGFGLIQTIVIVLLTIIFASMKIDEADLDLV